MPDQTLNKNLTYPRIEVYTEADLGDPKAGENTWTDPLGKKVYGGARDYKPHIQRQTFLLDETNTNALCKLSLKQQEEFGDTTFYLILNNYFELSKKGGAEFRALFPQDFSKIKALSPDDIAYSNLKLLYEDSHPRSITLIWLNETTWYVDELFYYLPDLYLLTEKLPFTKEIVAEGAFEDFLRYYAPVQLKIGEGFADLKPVSEHATLPLNEEVFGYTLSHGLPNTQPVSISIAGDGSLLQHGVKTEKRINPLTLVHILMLATSISWDHLAAPTEPKPAINNDKQVVTLSIWSRGKHYKLVDPDLSEDWRPLTHFVKKALQLLEL